MIISSVGRSGSGSIDDLSSSSYPDGSAAEKMFQCFALRDSAHRGLHISSRLNLNESMLIQFVTKTSLWGKRGIIFDYINFRVFLYLYVKIPILR